MCRHSSLTSFTMLAGAFFLLSVPWDIAAQEKRGPGEYIKEAADRLRDLVAAAHRDGYELHDNSFSLGGGWLKQSKETWVPLYTLKLEEGRKYRFIAVGDADATDVDLDVQDADGKVVARDAATDPTAVVDFTPKSSGRHTVRIRLYESRNDVPCFCIAIVMKKKS